MNIMFDSWQSWRVCMWSAFRKLICGLSRLVLFTIGGLLSLIRGVWRTCVGSVRDYPDIALGGAIVICFAVWILTFAQARVGQKTLEYQRDSLSYELSKFTQAYDTVEATGVNDSSLVATKWK